MFSSSDSFSPTLKSGSLCFQSMLPHVTHLTSNTNSVDDTETNLSILSIYLCRGNGLGFPLDRRLKVNVTNPILRAHKNTYTPIISLTLCANEVNGIFSITVTNYKFDRSRQCISTMTVEIDFLQKKNADSNPYNSDLMASEFIQHFNNQAFSVGQQVNPLYRRSWDKTQMFRNGSITVQVSNMLSFCM